jgi:hypothetical protein
MLDICPCKGKRKREVWETFEDVDGRPYYYERFTGRVTWETPAGVAAPKNRIVGGDSGTEETPPPPPVVEEPPPPMLAVVEAEKPQEIAVEEVAEDNIEERLYYLREELNELLLPPWKEATETRRRIITKAEKVVQSSEERIARMERLKAEVEKMQADDVELYVPGNRVDVAALLYKDKVEMPVGYSADGSALAGYFPKPRVSKDAEIRGLEPPTELPKFAFATKAQREAQREADRAGKEELEKQEGAVKIQSGLRAMKARRTVKEEREKKAGLWNKIKSVLKLQSVVRGGKARKSVVELRRKSRASTPALAPAPPVPPTAPGVPTAVAEPVPATGTDDRTSDGPDDRTDGPTGEGDTIERTGFLDRAAAVVQAVFRGGKTRKTVSQQRTAMGKAAATVQSVFRGGKTRQRVSEKRVSMARSSIALQAAFRGKKARNEVSKKRASITRSSITLQSAFRGKKARNEAKQRRASVAECEPTVELSSIKDADTVMEDLPKSPPADCAESPAAPVPVEDDDIPDPWLAYQTAEGNTYYYNAETSETAWRIPGYHESDDDEPGA